MILVVGFKMLPKSHCMLKAKKFSFIFLEEAFSNSCGPWFNGIPYILQNVAQKLEDGIFSFTIVKEEEYMRWV